MKFAAGKRFYQMLHGCPIFLRSLSLFEHRLSLFRPNYNDRDYPINVYWRVKKKEREREMAAKFRRNFKGKLLFIRKHDIKSTMEDSDIVKKEKKSRILLHREIRKRLVVFLI